jgi:nitrogen fixation protein FixH
MNTNAPKPTPQQIRQGRRWIVFIVSLLALNVAVCAITVTKALSDGGLVVEPDYDRKASNHAQAMRSAQASRNLGWTCTTQAPISADATNQPVEKTSTLCLKFLAADAKPVTDLDVRVTYFHRASAKQQTVVRLPEIAPGIYQALAPHDRVGVWELRVTAQRPGERFEDTLDLVVHPKAQSN